MASVQGCQHHDWVFGSTVTSWGNSVTLLTYWQHSLQHLGFQTNLQHHCNVSHSEVCSPIVHSRGGWRLAKNCMWREPLLLWNIPWGFLMSINWTGPWLLRSHSKDALLPSLVCCLKQYKLYLLVVFDTGMDDLSWSGEKEGLFVAIF